MNVRDVRRGVLLVVLCAVLTPPLHVPELQRGLQKAPRACRHRWAL